jgi:hypothetical protein
VIFLFIYYFIYHQSFHLFVFCFSFGAIFCFTDPDYRGLLYKYTYEWNCWSSWQCFIGYRHLYCWQCWISWHCLGKKSLFVVSNHRKRVNTICDKNAESFKFGDFQAYIVEYNAVLFVEIPPMIRRKMSPPSSWSKNKPNKNLAWSKQQAD